MYNFQDKRMSEHFICAMDMKNSLLNSQKFDILYDKDKIKIVYYYVEQ